KRLLLVTAHRRENHGAPLAAVCRALRELVAKFEDIEIVFPLHLNPNVQEPVRALIGSVPRIRLTAPLSYTDLLRVLQRCHVILTDSGGIQEEAPSFH